MSKVVTIPPLPIPCGRVLTQSVHRGTQSMKAIIMAPAMGSAPHHRMR